jgi:hypothetical protein
MKEKLKSRKLWVTIASILLGALFPASIPLLTILTPTYVGGQALVDAAAALKAMKS